MGKQKLRYKMQKKKKKYKELNLWEISRKI